MSVISPQRYKCYKHTVYILNDISFNFVSDITSVYVLFCLRCILLIKKLLLLLSSTSADQLVDSALWAPDQPDFSTSGKCMLMYKSELYDTWSCSYTYATCEL